MSRQSEVQARARARRAALMVAVVIVAVMVMAVATWWIPTSFGWPTWSLTAAIGWWSAFAAYLWFAIAGLALTVIDLKHRRLPDTIVIPALIGITVLLSMAALCAADGPDWRQLLSTLGGAAALFMLYLSIALIAPNGMGGGDVKFAPVTGAVLGFIGWGPLIVGVVAAFVMGALIAGVMMTFGRIMHETQVPFGPALVAGAWVGIIWGDTLINMYVTLFTSAS